MEENKLFSNMQGGFRRNRSTFTKLWITRNIFEDAKINNKFLDVCYIDIKKAYDSVEHWSIKYILKTYGFNQKFINIIADLYNNQNAQVITPYGLSDNFLITKGIKQGCLFLRGVRQGCLFSPVLFIIFLDPLFLMLENSKLGYKINDKIIPGGAFADDIILYAQNRIMLQKLVNIVQKYFKFFGLEICVDGRDKSIYTSNHIINLSIKVDKKVDNKWISTDLPFYKPNESYKYLGVWINLNLDWSEQIKISNFIYHKNIAYLFKRCFTASQTAEILNLVVFPAITYRMSIVNYDINYLKKWDKMARNLLSYKLKEKQFWGCKHWYLPKYNYGYNLFQFVDLQTINHVSNYLNFAANFPDKYVKATVRAVFNNDNNEVVKDLQQLLEPLMFKIIHNPSYIFEDYKVWSMHYCKNNMIYDLFIDANITSINSIINNNKLINNRQLENLFGSIICDDRIK